MTVCTQDEYTEYENLYTDNSLSIFVRLYHLMHKYAGNLQFIFAVLNREKTDNNSKDDTDDRAEVRVKAERAVNEYGNSILRLAYSYLHNMQDAEDVLQDTLIKLISKGPEFENSMHEKAWLLRVAGNISKNKLISNRIHMTDELDDELMAENREDLSFVWDAVKSLPVQYRETVHLFYYEGYSTEEIASILKKNDATVRSDLRRARIRLREILKEPC